MENKKISYQELKENINTYLDSLNILNEVNDGLKKEYLYEEIADNIEILKENFNKKENLNLSENELLIEDNNFQFSVIVEDEENSKNIHVISAKKDLYNNRFIYLIKDTALITIDKATGEYSVRDNIRDVVKDNHKSYNNCSVYALSKIRNFTKEGLEKNEIIMGLKRTINHDETIDFSSFQDPLFISNSDHITVANRVYFDVINYIEIDNRGKELFNGYQELSNLNGYRKFTINNDILGMDSICKISKEEIKEKLSKESDEDIKKILENEYTTDRDKFIYSKLSDVRKIKSRR
jgi:hypothetical protein